MADSVAYQHTDSNRDNYGSYKLHGVKKVGTDRNLLVPYSIKLNRRLNVFLTIFCLFHLLSQRVCLSIRVPFAYPWAHLRPCETGTSPPGSWSCVTVVRSCFVLLFWIVILIQ